MLDSLLFAFNSVAPIIFTVAIGYILKKMGMMPKDFSKLANKLVFRIFLPVMLFMNIYGIESFKTVELDYIIYTVASVLIFFLLGIPTVILVTKKKEYRGALFQGIFRSNYALIGIPLATALFGSSGAAVATLLSAFVIPLFNVLAVVGLSIFAKDADGKGSLKKVLIGILKNPLIWGIAVGLLALGIRAAFVGLDISFRLNSINAVWGTLKNLSNIATPLALLVLGAQFEFSDIPSMKRELIAGVLLRSVIVPVLGLGVAFLAFRGFIDGAEFAALVAVFATPVAVSSVPMAQEMNADVTLAGSLVVFTTICSAFTVFIASFILRSLGVF